MALDPAWDCKCHERNRMEYLALSRLTKTQGRLPTRLGPSGGPKEVPEPRMERCLSYPPQTGRQRAVVYDGAVRQHASREDGVHQQTKTSVHVDGSQHRDLKPNHIISWLQVAHRQRLVPLENMSHPFRCTCSVTHVPSSQYCTYPSCTTFPLSTFHSALTPQTESFSDLYLQVYIVVPWRSVQ
jgi:hypothetical protein